MNFQLEEILTVIDRVKENIRMRMRALRFRGNRKQAEFRQKNGRRAAGTAEFRKKSGRRVAETAGFLKKSCRRAAKAQEFRRKEHRPEKQRRRLQESIRRRVRWLARFIQHRLWTQSRS